MTRHRWWLIGIPLAVVAAGVVAMLSIDPRAIVEAEIADATGRAVTLDALDLDLGTVTEVRLSGLTIAGETADAPAMAKIDSIDLQIEVWPLLSDQLRLPKLSVSGGRLHLSPRSVGGGGEGDGLKLEHVGEASIDDISLTMMVQGRAAEATLAHLGAVYDAASGRTTLAGNGTLGGAPFTLAGTTAQPGQLLADRDGEIPIDVSLNLADASATVQGALRPGPSLQARVEAKAPEMADLLRLVGIDMAPIGPVAAIARLGGDAEAIAADDVTIDVGRRGGMLSTRVTGRVADVMAMHGVDLAFETTVPDLHALAPLLGQAPPIGGRLAATGRVGDADGRLTVPQIEMHLQDDGRHDLTVAGRIGALPFADADLKVSGVVHALPSLPSPLPEVLRQVAPLTVAGTLTGGLQVLHVADLSIASAGTAPVRFTVAGSVERLVLAPQATATGIDLVVDGRIPSLSAAAPVLAALRPGMALPTLPDLGEIALQAAIGGSSEAPSLRNLRAEVVSGPAAGSAIAGDIGNLLAVADTQLTATLRARSLAAFDPGLPADSGEVLGDMTVTAAADGSIALKNAEVRIGEMALTGGASLLPGGTFTGEFRTAHLQLDKLVGGGGAAAGNDHVFPNTPLPFAALRDLDADVSFVADTVSAGPHSGGTLTLRLAASGGKARFTLMPFAIPGGEMAATLDVDTTAQPPHVRLVSRGKGIDLAVVSTLLRQPAAITGRADIDIRLGGRGDSPHDIAASLDGEAAIVAANGTIESGLVNLVAADLLTEVVSQAGTSPPSTPLQCLLADFRVDRGVADAKALFLSTDKIVVTGRGAVRLGPERYDLSLLPAPKDPSLLSLAQRVNVTGPLTDPVFTPDTGSLAWSAVQALVGNALLPGAGLLLPMLSAGSGQEHPCATEVKAMPKEKGVVDKATGAVGGAAKAVGGAVDKAGEAVGGAVKGLKKLFD